MSHDWTTLCAVAFACVVAVDAVRRRPKKTRSLPPYPLPPGPPPLPIIGNIHGINASAPWLTYAEWSKAYGDLVYSRFFDQDVIIINSEKVAKALLEDRSCNYSGRPHLVTNELFGIDFNTVLMPYGDRWRLQRRFFHQTFKANSASRFIPMQQRKAHLLALRIIGSPDQVFEHIHEYTSSVIINAIYGYDPASPDDHMVDIIGRACKLIAVENTPEAAGILSAFPIILNIPSWFPGMSIKKKAALCRDWAKDWVEIPFEHALRRMNEGSTSPAMVFDGLRDKDRADTTAARMQALKDAAATGFAAASESSNAVLTTFLLVMVLHPAVQDWAYAQIDAIVGKERLPTPGDRPSLPYIDAIIRETMRWSPVLPLSIPHSVVNDDVYDGYYIPKGAIVMTNLWSMAHDGSKYPKPFEFIPERFLHPDGTLTSDNVQNIAFGFGRRICVGRHFAEMSLWYVVATILALWKVSLPKDEHGNDVPYEPKWAPGLTTYPLPFPCHFEPRIPGLDTKLLEELIHASV